jgi:UDP-N-acetylmuramate dehydrogenase
VLTDAHRRALQDAFSDRVRFREPLSRHTSFRIGGPADVWVEVDDAADIGRLQAFAAGADMPLYVLGGGTNILVSDRGVRGIVVHLSRAFAAIEWRENGGGMHVRSGAAVALKKLVVEAIERDLAGLEFAEGIPGSVGGGLLMNAGAFGGEISRVVEYVEGVTQDGAVRRLPRAELKFEYRNFDLERGFVVTHVGFLLGPGDASAIRAQRADAKRRREARQPLGYPNAGSIFKNPPGKYAGRLIEAAGLKGMRVGGAMFSEQHANFIVNVGGATAGDVRALMRTAEQRVLETEGVHLQPEIKLVGEWDS